MTRRNDHEPEEPEVTAATDEAKTTLKKVVTLLQLAGWDVVTLSISRVIEVGPNDFRAPGATATVIDMGRHAPVAGQIAEVLRKQAAMLDRGAGGQTLDSGYIQDASNYASNLREWPR